MVVPLAPVTLKSGETVSAAAIRGPDDAWRERISRLLVHKGDPWIWQNTELLSRDTGIDAWFYVLDRDGAPFAHMFTAECNGVGLFGHVWTEPADRQQGAAALLMARQMAHFRARRGRALYLNTAADSPAFRLYARHGFTPIAPGSGAMRYIGAENFDADYFAPSPIRIEPLDWRHWATAPALFLAPIPGHVRCAPLKLYGYATTEEALLPFLQSPVTPSPLLAATTKTGALVGFAAQGPDPLNSDGRCVDVFCYPRFWPHADSLLDALLAHTPPGQLFAYADTACPEKSGVLLRAGFRQVSAHPHHFPGAGLLVFKRPAPKKLTA